MPEQTPAPDHHAAIDAIASSLYPELPKTADAGAPIRDNVSAAERALFPVGKVPELDAVPPEVAALRADPARVGINVAGSFAGQTAELKAMAEAADLTAAPEVVAKQVLEFKALALDIEANGDDVSMIAGLAKSAFASPISDETNASNAREASEAMRLQYGKDFGRVMTDAQALVARDPRLKALLSSTGLGNHPRVVARMCELGQQARRNGRLK